MSKTVEDIEERGETAAALGMERPAAAGLAAAKIGPPLRKDGAFRALHQPAFRIFWTGNLVSLIGTWAQNLAQGWLIVLLVDPVAREMLRHGGVAGGGGPPSPTTEAAANQYSGWVNFAGGLPIFLFTLLAGVVADRVDKRRLLLLTQSVLIGSALGLGLLTITGRVELWHVLLFAGVSGLAAAFDMPTRQSFVIELVGRENLTSAVALNSSVFNAARALGPAVAGLLLAAHVSIGAAYLGTAALTLAAIAALTLIKGRYVPAPIAPAAGPLLLGIWDNMREGFAYVKKTPTVRNLVLLVGSFGLFAFSFNVLIPVFVRYTLLPHAPNDVQVKAFGILETVRGIGALCGALTVALLGSASRQRAMLLLGSFLSTTLLFVFALARAPWLAYLTMAIVSYGFVLCFATSNTLMQLTVPDGLRGRVMSIYTLMFIGTMPFGSLFAGWLAGQTNATVGIMVCAGLSLLTVTVLTLRPGGLRDVGKSAA